jgi:hypothetical protein
VEATEKFNTVLGSPSRLMVLREKFCPRLPRAVEKIDIKPSPFRETAG